MSTKDCLHEEGYLMLYSETDEIHVDLITEEHYKKIIGTTEADSECEVAFGTEPLYRWFTQTHCIDPWPYNKVKILGTTHVVRC